MTNEPRFRVSFYRLALFIPFLATFVLFLNFSTTPATPQTIEISDPSLLSSFLRVFCATSDIPNCAALTVDDVLESASGDFLSFAIQKYLTSGSFVTLDLEGRTIVLNKGIFVTAGDSVGINIMNGFLTGMPPKTSPEVPISFMPPSQRTVGFPELNAALDFSGVGHIDQLKLTDLSIQCDADSNYAKGANNPPIGTQWPETMQHRTTCDGVVLSGNYTNVTLENVLIQSVREFGLIDKQAGGTNIVVNNSRFMHDAAAPPESRTSIAIFSQATNLTVSSSNIDYFRVGVFSTGPSNSIWGNHICAGNAGSFAAYKPENIYLTNPAQQGSQITVNYIDNGFIHWGSESVKEAELKGLQVHSNFWLTTAMAPDPALQSDNPQGAFSWMVLDYPEMVSSRSLKNFTFADNLFMTGDKGMTEIPWANNPISLETVAVKDNGPVEEFDNVWIARNNAEISDVEKLLHPWIYFDYIEHPISGYFYDTEASSRHEFSLGMPFSCTPQQVVSVGFLPPPGLSSTIGLTNELFSAASSSARGNSYDLGFATSVVIEGTYSYRLSCNPAEEN